MIRYGSLCSGIEAATVAWHGLGWEPAWFSQFDPEHSYRSGPDFPSAVLAHHYPTVPNLGDMTAADWMDKAAALGDIDVLVGGTPCQDFSIAGLRKGLDGDRGQLSLRFCEIANAADPSVILWENVPGVLSDHTNGFGCLLAGLAGEDVPLQPPGGKWTDAGCVFGPQRTIAWRVLDAQYFGVAQRRRRVFVVACSAASGLDPAEILFEFDGVRRDSPPSREEREGVAAGPGAGAEGASWSITCRTRGGVKVPEEEEEEEEVSPALMGRAPRDSGEACVSTGVDLRNGTITGEVAMTVQVGQAGHSPDPGGTPHLLQTAISGDCAGTLDANYGKGPGSANFGGRECVACYTSDGQVADPIGANEARTYTNEGVTFRLRNCVDQGAAAVGTDCYNGTITGDIAATMGTPGSSVNASGPTVMTYEGYGEDLSHLDGVSVFENQRAEVKEQLLSNACVQAGGKPGQGYAAARQSGCVRRLTPTECCRLQGFPDGYTQIPWKGKPAAACPDGPRYKALGNSMAVPVITWLGQRIAAAMARRNDPA